MLLAFSLISCLSILTLLMNDTPHEVIKLLCDHNNSTATRKKYMKCCRVVIVERNLTRSKSDEPCINNDNSDIGTIYI